MAPVVDVFKRAEGDEGTELRKQLGVARESLNAQLYAAQLQLQETKKIADGQLVPVKGALVVAQQREYSTGRDTVVVLERLLILGLWCCLCRAGEGERVPPRAPGGGGGRSGGRRGRAVAADPYVVLLSTIGWWSKLGLMSLVWWLMFRWQVVGGAELGAGGGRWRGGVLRLGQVGGEEAEVESWLVVKGRRREWFASHHITVHHDGVGRGRGRSYIREGRLKVRRSRRAHP